MAAIVGRVCQYTSLQRKRTRETDKRPCRELPEGATGMQAFYQCTALTGGNGTAFDAKSAGAGMMRIDREGQAGYLTAG